MSQKQVDAAARRIWNYLKLGQVLGPADAILVLGSHDLRIAQYGAELFLKKFAPLIVFSGNRGRLTASWRTAEADAFAQVAIRAGVPRSRILFERESTNTGENVLFTKRLLAARGLTPRRLIAVHKPYMERRTWATFRKVWPQPRVMVTSPPLSFDDYAYGPIPKRKFIAIMLGDLQRIRLYARTGFQIRQPIPRPVVASYQALVRRGYTEHLLKTPSGIIPI